MRVREERVHVVEGPWDARGVARGVVEGGAAEGGAQDEPFYVMDVGEVLARLRLWRAAMPRVQPFYAVKCNDHSVLLKTLAALGTGFDCASKAEIETILKLGVTADRIIFANPAKMASHIRYASAVAVRTVTFDNETELMKLKHYMPEANLVIRIRCDAADAQCPLGIKFGCDPVQEAPRLLKLASVLGLSVVGVSFHVGSGARELAVYRRAVALSRALFDMAQQLGIKMGLLDIGGGFSGATGSGLEDVSKVINGALDEYFPVSEGVKVIAEPGRYFAAAAYTLVTCVHSRREVYDTDSTEPHTMYFINDGVYGSFNCVLYDHQVVHPETLKTHTSALRPSSVWGPSCDGLDQVTQARLPALALGEWLLWRDLGAYTLPVASAFNGFPVPRVKALVRPDVWSILKDLRPFDESDFVFEPPFGGPNTPTASLSPPLSPQRDHLPSYVECALK